MYLPEPAFEDAFGVEKLGSWQREERENKFQQNLRK